MRDVIGQDGQRYRLTRRLGAGGQGVVYAVEGGRLAAKLLLDGSEEARFRLRARLEEVRRLPVESLPLARPLVVLRGPDCGYVMELLTGMGPILQLARPEGEDIVAWYKAGGGLRRRLGLLEAATRAVHRLHAGALVWGDPSPHNVFIAEDAASNEVRLIDTDNLRWTSRPGATVYSEAYAAPELRAGRSGVTTLSDAHAMAVVAFEVLALCHPLLGDAVREAEEEVEDAALAGAWPWIDDPDDERNRSSAGIGRELLLTRGLRELFGRFFGVGLRDPLQRPGAGELADALGQAWAATVACCACGWTFLFREAGCPCCDAPRGQMVLAEVGRWSPELEAPELGSDGRPARLGVLALSDGDERSVPATLTGGVEVALRLEGRRMWVRSQGWLRAPEGRHTIDLGGVARPVDLAPGRRPWTLHLGPPERPHWMITPHLHGAA